jgi:RimJ/RimL family protein N-acetyltransferase
MRTTDTPQLHTRRLAMDPLQVGDASEMVNVLDDRGLYKFTGGDPPSLQDLESRYRKQVAGSESSDEVWHNWILRLMKSGQAIGFVQATVTADTADVAWVVGADWQRRGYASEAAVEMCRWLRETGISSLTAHIHPEHDASARIAEKAGLRRTAEVDADGEVVWAPPRTN